jgi:hypothetical protein
MTENKADMPKELELGKGKIGSSLIRRNDGGLHRGRPCATGLDGLDGYGGFRYWFRGGRSPALYNRRRSIFLKSEAVTRFSNKKITVPTATQKAASIEPP